MGSRRGLGDRGRGYPCPVYLLRETRIPGLEGEPAFVVESDGGSGGPEEPCLEVGVIFRLCKGGTILCRGRCAVRQEGRHPTACLGGVRFEEVEEVKGRQPRHFDEVELPGPAGDPATVMLVQSVARPDRLRVDRSELLRQATVEDQDARGKGRPKALERSTDRFLLSDLAPGVGHPGELSPDRDALGRKGPPPMPDVLLESHRTQVRGLATISPTSSPGLPLELVQGAFDAGSVRGEGRPASPFISEGLWPLGRARG